MISLMYVPGHDLNSKALLNLDAFLSHSSYGCTWNSKITFHINKKTEKLTSSSQYPSSTIHIIIYYNKLNSGCCLSIDFVYIIGLMSIFR